MVRRIAAGIAMFTLLVMPLSAQRIEVSASGGYTASEGVTVDDRAILGIIYNSVDVVSGGSFNFTFGVFTTPNFLIEFQYGRQMSKLRASGPGLGAETDVSEMNVD